MKNGHLKILLAGNPNSGKTTIFNELSGMRAKVGNYAGVTVEKKTGKFSAGGFEIEVEDLPGVYTLSASTAEEKVAADAISAGDFDLIVNVVDSSNFERNLFLTMQLAEMKMPMIVALNMSDELENARHLSSDIADQMDNIGYKELMKLVTSLPPGFRTVFNMYVIEGYSHREIAEILGITETTSRTQLSRARIWLQNRIKAKGR